MLNVTLSLVQQLTLVDKIQIYDLKCFDNIVIYVAGNDCADMNSDWDFEIIEEKYDQLLNQIRDKNADINLYLCSLCPRVDTLVKDVNDMIKRQCEDHQGTLIDVHKAFYNKRNQLKVHFYQPRDNIHLAASGTSGERGGSVVECRTPEREVRGSRPTAAVLCP